VAVVSTIPCKTCPWRVGSTPHDIPNFSLAKAQALSCTVGEGDEFRKIMACHGSDEGAESPCIGYIAQEGYSNLAVRVMAMRDRIDFPAIMDACEPLDLYHDFDAMLDNIEQHYS
jgi:hypothetical protein